MELYEKIYVEPAFLETDHGEFPCQQCHGGNPADDNWETAHNDLVRDPTYPDPTGTCGECHEDIAASAVTSLHYTLDPIKAAIDQRAGPEDPATVKLIDVAVDRHCFTCHASCGQCHVSRPDYADGGLLAAHRFIKTPSMDTTCASCHGGRVHGEYTGADNTQNADVHYVDQEMDCMACHQSTEMHAAAHGAATRFNLPERPNCLTCHPDVIAEDGTVESHTVHQGKLACQVCHAQAAKSCFNCHVGTDKKGLPYYKCQKTEMVFKIGLNPDPSPQRPHEYVLLRHPPITPETFDAYLPNGLKHFDRLPTWKMDTPHNIQRITPQNKACNNCHGLAQLFLRESDLASWEVTANRKVIVPENRIPEFINEEAD